MADDRLADLLQILLRQRRLRRGRSSLASGDVLSHVLREYLVDERLVPDASASRLLPELLEHTGVDANGDQLPRRVAERRATDPAHRTELFGRRLRDVAEVNPARRTPRARAGSRAAR